MAIAKFGGRDCELSTTGVDADGQSIESWDATRRILDKIPASLADHGSVAWSSPVYRSNYATSNSWYYQGSAISSDCLRHWTDAGQCYYSDMGHVEVCTATCLRPTEFAAQCISTLLAAEAARAYAEEESNDGSTFSLTTSNADMLDPTISFGTHLSMQVSKPLWEELNEDQQRPATLGFVASALAAAVPFFGAGYLLPLRDGSIIYSLSARAHHLRKMRTLSTTQAFGRGLLNSRREAHEDVHERLHMIGFDFDVLSSALLFSFLQCMLAAAEEGHWGTILAAPLRAMRSWSWQLDDERDRLSKTVLTIDGTHLTLPAYMRRLCEELLRMVQSGLITPAVAPEAETMLNTIIELADHAEQGRLVDCARHLGWAAKRVWLAQLAEDQHGAVNDASARVADHDFVSTDPHRGGFWRLWDAGLIDPLCHIDQAKACLKQGPVDSRDWGRGQIIRRFYEYIESVDWSYISLRSDNGRWSPRLRIDLPTLQSLNKAAFESILAHATDPATLYQLLIDCPQTQLHENNPLDDPTNQLAVVSRHGSTNNSN